MIAPTASASNSPNDPLFTMDNGVGQWGLRQLYAPESWSRSTGAGTTIAIVDSGVDRDHDDLAAKVLPGATFVDGCQPSCGDGDWESGPLAARSAHGTHVAGIAAASTGNGIGIAGTAPDARILPVKVTATASLFDLPCFARTWQDVARGITWAVDNGAHVINLSLGDPLPGHGTACTTLAPAVASAIADASSRGVVVVAAAGNESFAACSGPPGSSPGAVCVTATDSNELPAEYANRPVRPDLVAVAAPGGGSVDYQTRCGGAVLSTVPSGTSAWGSSCGYGDEYDEMMGTSMASPHVAGVAALLMAQGCTREETIDLLMSTARHPFTGARGVYSPDYGYGIVDADASTAAAAVAVCTSNNATPLAVADSGQTSVDTPITLPVLANDSDADGDTLTITSVTSPGRGTATINNDSTITYTPASGFTGRDGFRYAVTDGRGGKAEAPVTVDVRAANAPPDAVDDRATTNKNKTVNVPVLENDTDADDHVLRVIAVTTPRSGSATVEPDGTVTYRPGRNFEGEDVFEYTIDDGEGGRDTARVVVLVRRPGDGPSDPPIRSRLALTAATGGGARGR